MTLLNVGDKSFFRTMFLLKIPGLVQLCMYVMLAVNRVRGSHQHQEHGGQNSNHVKWLESEFGRGDILDVER
jgi:hypothetical protein